MGATALSRDELAPAYRDYIGRSVTTADLGALAERITAIYQNAGFSLSRAIIPPQDIENGSVRVAVLEGYIDDIVLEGSQAQDFGARKLLAPLLGERPLSQKTLERYMLLVDDTPGVQVADTALEEIGQTTGRFRLVVALETWRLFLGTGLDNRGSSEIGRAQGYVAPAVNSIRVAGDSLDLALSSVPDQTQELRFARLGYGASVGNNGARISGNVTYGQIWPGDERRYFGDYTETVRIQLKGTIVPLRTRDASAWVSLSGDVDDVRERDDFGVISDDHVRALTLTTDVELRDRFSGSNYVTLGLRRGLTIWGASESGDGWLSRADGSGDFTVADIQYSRYQKISDTWSFNFSAAAQLASTALLASEEYYLGGAAFGRAYDGGAVSGDNALAGSFELRYDQSVERAFLKGYQLYAFADHGVVWDFRRGATSVSADVGRRRRSAVSPRRPSGLARACGARGPFVVRK